MRIAVVSDIHGNLTALEAVVADLRETAPDIVFLGGDLAHGGPRPVEIVDRIRELGWQGVLGNADEMMFLPQSLTEFAAQAPHLNSLFAVIEDMAEWTREILGEQRIEWLKGLPLTQVCSSMALVHASTASTWRAPGHEAGDAELEDAYGPLGRPIAVYAHIHRPFVRQVSALTVANTGSVSLPHDGDRRASYLLLDDAGPAIRRVEYDVDAEIRTLNGSGLPHADWVARSLAGAAFQMP